MDAIMLQEKLVERLLCPRVRTARQKVKRWEEILGKTVKISGFNITGERPQHQFECKVFMVADLLLRGIFLQFYQQFVPIYFLFFLTELLVW